MNLTNQTYTPSDPHDEAPSRRAFRVFLSANSCFVMRGLDPRISFHQTH